MAPYPQSRSLLLWVPQFMILIAFFPIGSLRSISGSGGTVTIPF